MNFNNLHQIKICIVLFSILLIIGIFLTIYSSFITNLYPKIVILLISLILTILCPFIIGELHNEFKVKNEAINELCEKICMVWQKAIENEKKSKDEEYLKKHPEIRAGKKLIFKSWNFDKEVGIVYLLAIYLVNVKWYEHHLFNLPLEYKEQIKNYLNECEKIHFNLLSYEQMDLEYLSKYDYTRFTPEHTQNYMEPFLSFILKECSEENKINLNKILKCRREYDIKHDLN